MSELAEAQRRALDHLWSEVEAHLDDDALHQKYVRFAVDNELYLPAIERYKALAAAHPERAALAEKQQKAVAAQAAAKAFARAPKEPERARSPVMALVVVILFAVALVFAIATSMAPGP